MSTPKKTGDRALLHMRSFFREQHLTNPEQQRYVLCALGVAEEDRRTAEIVASIDDALEDYRWFKEVRASLITRGEQRTQLRRVLSAIDELMNSIQGLDPHLRETVLRNVPRPTIHLSGLTSRFDEQLGAMQCLQKAANQLLPSLPTESAGRKGEPDLKQLVKVLAELWCDVTGERFSATKKRRPPCLTPTEFVIRAIRAVDRHIAEKAIQNMVAEIARDQNRNVRPAQEN